MASLGGSAAAPATRRILEAIMSQKVAVRYSWLGQKGKKKFSVLNIATLIISELLSFICIATAYCVFLVAAQMQTNLMSIVRLVNSSALFCNTSEVDFLMDLAIIFQRL